MPKLTKENISIGVLVILHTIGVIGLSSSWQEYFLVLTPINLVVSGYFVLRHGAKKWAGLYVLIAVLTYLVEALGIHTGFPFGEYSYGRGLGPQLFNVPILIGLLWLLLLMGASFFISKITRNILLHSLIVAAIMTALDVAIEPVAIALDFWSWFSVHVPWNNYAGWFATALLLSFISKTDSSFGNNKVAGVFFIIQTVFFLCLNLTL
ncbi:MAG: carotenoid biosynthesis protein [Flavobacteriales bacterium]|nr:carotenoid biosynthesis protein [Flavobacteriales bacterium]